MAKRFGINMLTPIKGSRKSRHNNSRSSSASHASMSVMSDNDTTYSMEGQQSIAAKTVDSQATIKVSNKQAITSSSSSSDPNHSDPNHSEDLHKKESKGWRTIRRLVSKKSPPGTPNRAHAQSYDGEASAKSNSTNSSSMWPAYPVRRRILSLDAANQKRAADAQQSPGAANPLSRRSVSARDRTELDLKIRGRLDGVDTLSLGPACQALRLATEYVDQGLPITAKSIVRSSPLKETMKNPTSPNRNGLSPLRTPTKSIVYSNDDDDDSDLNLEPLSLSFTGKPISCTPAEIVAEMIWTSAGKENPELIFEGYVPGGSDRWSVKLEDATSATDEPPAAVALPNNATSSTAASTPSSAETATTSSTDAEPRASTPDPTDEPKSDKHEHNIISDDDESTAVMTEDGSPSVPVHQLWDQMWGDDSPPPMPSHMQAGAESDKDEVLQLAAACSVPIDLDEDTFLIESPEHLRAVHDLAMVPLQGRRFESALMIFENLLAGLRGSSGEKFEHLVGVTHHNIGIIHMCQGHYGDALRSFQKAVVVRRECLPQNHPDIAVSLARQGTAYFALEAFDQALKCFNMALNMNPNEDATRAKLLNSIGVVHAFRQRYSDALKAFTSALEIQRVWLEGPVRREPIVYDAAVTLINMGKVYLHRGDYDLSYFVYEEACVLQTTAFRKDHDIVLMSLDNMARVLAKNNEFEKAIQILSSMHRSQKARFGPDNENCIETLGMIGYMHARLVELKEALTHLNIVSNWQYKNLPPSHPAVRLTRETMTKVRSCKDGEASLWI